MSDLISREAAIAALGVIADQRDKAWAERALRSLPPAQEAAPAVKVKPLEWEGKDPDFTAAYGLLGRYTVINTHSDRGFLMMLSDRHDKTYTPTLEAAKAAAQADYERRILAALDRG